MLVEIADEDDQFEHWIATARRLVESLLDVSLITQTIKVYLDEFPDWEIEVPRSPRPLPKALSHEAAAALVESEQQGRQADVKANAQLDSMASSAVRPWPDGGISRISRPMKAVEIGCGIGLASLVLNGRNADITAFLQRHGRSGVPLYLLAKPAGSDGAAGRAGHGRPLR